MVRWLVELTPRGARALADDGAVALVPLGQVVPHGEHLPIGTDAIIAGEVAERLAGRLEADGLPAVIAPALPTGHAPLYAGMPGALSMGAVTLGAALADMTASLAANGFDRQVVLMQAPGSWPSVGVASERADQRSATVLTIDLLAWFRGVAESVPETRRIQGPDGHAGALETSVMRHLRPDLTHPERAPSGDGPRYGQGQPEFRGLSTNERLAAFGVTSWEQLGDGGVVGDATQADADVGAAVMKAAVEALARHVTGALGPAPHKDERGPDEPGPEVGA